MTPSKVLLISMPFGALERQALGLSLLKPLVTAGGVDCEIRYLNLRFADLIGHDEYTWMSSGLPYTAFAGDWTFTSLLYGERPRADAAYVAEILRGVWSLPDADVDRLLRLRPLARVFLDHCLATIPWDEVAIVGFTSTFEQNVASLALARHAKRAWPHLVTVFGGANWEGEMGVELHRRFRFVDYACSGEAERSFPALVEHVLARRPPDAASAIAGIVFRREGESISTGPPALVTQLDELPAPDFTDYFATLDRSACGTAIVPTLLFETSRGCWWGAKQHCTFCGLNGESMTYRRKSAARAVDELYALVARWSLELVEVVDNILDMRYFADFLPTLAARPSALQIFYEVKSNLSRRQIALLAMAGVNRVQPGIESLSDHVLRLMRKGTTGLRNVQMLKWCKEYGIGADWNLLYGFPGETREDYEQTLALLPAIRFLGAPVAWGPVRLDRFSPYFDAPATFGIRDVRPLAPYRHLYPFPASALARIAYYFDYDLDPAVHPAGYAEDVVAYLEEWRRTPETGTLRAVDRLDGALVLHDSRSAAAQPEVVLHGIERTIYELCDEQQTFATIASRVHEASGGVPIDDGAIRGFLDSLVANHLMVRDATHYLSLALGAAEQPARRAADGPTPMPVGLSGSAPGATLG